MKATLAQLAAQGPRDFYEGDLARSIAADIQSDGGALSVEDLAAFRAHLREPLAIPYRGGKIFATPELTAGPTMAHALAPPAAESAARRAARMRRPTSLMRWRCNRPIANACRTWAMPTAGARSAPKHLAPACTTHFSAVDRDGNMAAVTQTLLSTFGSQYVTPQTGVTMNNGIMWFDPTPGTPNSLAPGKRCLTNYTPVVAHAADGRRLAVGASGGRRILPAVTQLLSFVMDYGMDLDAAIHQPRIDASEGAVVIGDVRLPAQTRSALGERFDYEEARMQTHADEVRLPERGAARRRDQQRRHGAVPAVGRRGGGRVRDTAIATRPSIPALSVAG